MVNFMLHVTNMLNSVFLVYFFLTQLHIQASQTRKKLPWKGRKKKIFTGNLKIKCGSLKNKLWEFWEGTDAHFDIACPGLTGQFLILREKLLLLQPLPHYKGGIRMESFLRERKEKKKEVRASIKRISQQKKELQRQKVIIVWHDRYHYNSHSFLSAEWGNS